MTPAEYDKWRARVSAGYVKRAARRYAESVGDVPPRPPRSKKLYAFLDGD